MFAMRFIKAGEELCYDYGYKVGGVVGKTLACYCGAPNCREVLY